MFAQHRHRIASFMLKRTIADAQVIISPPDRQHGGFCAAANLDVVQECPKATSPANCALLVFTSVVGLYFCRTRANPPTPQQQFAVLKAASNQAEWPRSVILLHHAVPCRL
jgi:hypothetical protein